MRTATLIHHIYGYCRDRLRRAGLGRTLLIIVCLKLFIIFAVLKLFFFPDFIRSKVPDGRQADYVSSQCMERAGANDE